MLTQSARTPPAVHPGITISVDEIEIKKIKERLCQGDFFLGGDIFVSQYFLFLDEIEYEKK